MLINKGGVLGEEYFISYLKLVKNSLNCSNEEAYNITFSRLFKDDPDTLGNKSYETFQQAFIQFNEGTALNERSPST